MESREEFGREAVTHEEAAQMIELWAREPGKEVVELRDVVEALGISDVEGARLLAQVRDERTRSGGAPWTLALAASLLFAAAVVWTKGGNVYRGFYMSEADWLLLIAACLWLAAWSFYYHRTVVRALRRFAQGPGGPAQGEG